VLRLVRAYRRSLTELRDHEVAIRPKAAAGADRYLKKRVQPVILSCGLNESVFEQFVESFCAVSCGLARPIVVIDTTNCRRLSNGYISLVRRLDPLYVEIHPREHRKSRWNSVQEASKVALERGLAEVGTGDFVLFLEDDIIFSSQFLQVLNEIEVAPDAGLVTFFIPSGRYPVRVVNRSDFIGTMCVLLPAGAAEKIVANWKKMSGLRRLRWGMKAGYDIRWANYLGTRGYRLYRTDFSYVQHIGKDSRLGNSPYEADSFVN
jgi:hypothetical protein